MARILATLVCGCSLCMQCQNVLADKLEQHNAVDRIYHPYVQALEKEFGYRSIYQSDNRPGEDDLMRHHFSYGQAVSQNIFVEGYLIGVKPPAGSFRIEKFELESLIQLTEQGQYWADWGLMFELSRERSEFISELDAILVSEKELGRWTVTGNLGTGIEFGSDIRDEVDVDFKGQLRYRLNERLEPGMEYYKDEFTDALGPVLQGVERLGTNKKLHWELGALFHLNNTTPETTWRMLLEFEF